MYVAQISSFGGPSSIATVHYEVMIKAAFPRTTIHKLTSIVETTPLLYQAKKESNYSTATYSGLLIHLRISEDTWRYLVGFRKIGGCTKTKIPSTFPF
jgi:hypothetical protein